MSGGSAASVTAAPADCVVSDVVGDDWWGELLGRCVGASDAEALSEALADPDVSALVGLEVGTPPPLVDPWVGWFDGDAGGFEVGFEVGCEVGDAGECDVGATPGGAWAEPFCHDSATYPPSGTFSDPTPTDA